VAIKNKTLNRQAVKGKYAVIQILIVTLLLVGIFEIFWLIKYGNTPQIYKDIVLEELGAEFANKSIELSLYWIGMIFGLIIIAICLVFYRKGMTTNSKDKVVWRDQNFIAAILSVILLGNYIFYGYFNSVVVLAEIVMLCSLIFFNGKTLEAVTFYFVLLYSITAIYRLGVYLGSDEILNQTLASIVAMAITLAILVFHREKIIKATLIMQIPIPLLLLIYLIHDYEYQGQTIHIKPEKTVYIAIIGCMLILAGIELWNVKKNWRENTINNCVNAGSSIAIMAFQRFSGIGYVMLNDMHHPAENTIAYNEIANLGRAAFSEYVPVSGLYSYVQGLFLEVFGKGYYTAYSLTNNIYYLAIIILLVVALRLHLSPILTFFCSIFIYVSDYSRVALILPFMLILLSKKLISKPNLWLILWILFSWCYGLYYPAYGVAIIVALLFLGGYQVRCCIEEIKAYCFTKRSMYAVMYLCLLGGIIASIPLLIGMLKHVIAMGDGMLYVDGVTIFGQALPNDFLGCLNNNTILFTIRLIIGYVVRFSVPMLTVWIAFFSIWSVFRDKTGRTWKNICFNLEIEELSILAAFIFPIVCFYFSLYRMGAGNLFNRAVYIIDFSLIIVSVIVYEYGKMNFDKYLLILAAIFLCTLGNSIGINGLAGKYYKNYIVGDEYVFTGLREDIPRLGKGFVRHDLMENIENAAVKYQTLDHNKNYYALFANGDHGMAYDEIFNIKGTAMLETMMVRGYRICLETAERLIKCDTIVGNQISPVDHYYLYKWLCTGGEYIWSNTDQLFYPVKNQNAQEIRSANSLVIASMPTYDAGRYAASLGNSLDSLQDVLTEQVQITYNKIYRNGSVRLEFDEILDGNTVDYIYLDLNIDRKKHRPFIMGSDHTAGNKLEAALMKHEYNSGKYVMVEWQDDKGEWRSMKALAENGKLLIPIGAGVGWLNNYHSDILFSVYEDEIKLPIPEINELGVYRLRDLTIQY
jgi:hypothetical protein